MSALVDQTFEQREDALFARDEAVELRGRFVQAARSSGVFVASNALTRYKVGETNEGEPLNF